MPQKKADKAKEGKGKTKSVGNDDIYKLYKETAKSLVSFTQAFLLDGKGLAPSKFHYWLSDMLLKSRDNLAIEGFRESGKTTYVVYAYPLYCLTFPREDRSYIVLLKASDTLAKGKLHEIRDMYLNNKLMSANVQKVYAQGDVLDVLTKEGVRVRIEAYGKGTNIRGLTWQTKRPDIVIMDDIQTVDDVRSETVSETDWEWFLSDVYMLSKSSRIFMIGNNLGDRCVIERLSGNAEQFGFKFYRVPAIIDGRATWPERLSLEFLQKEREAYAKAGKLSVWLRERMCQSVSEESRVFKQSWFKYYDRLPQARYNVYIGVDLAVSQKRTADYTAMAVVYVNKDNNRFIEDLVYGRFEVHETIDKLFDLVVKHKPVEVAIEKVAFQAVMEAILHKEMLRRNSFFRLNMMSVPRSTSKLERILSLQPLYASGSIWHKRDAEYTVELESELSMVTRDGIKSKHDDLIDALEMANRIARPPALSARLGQRKARMI